MSHYIFTYSILNKEDNNSDKISACYMPGTVLISRDKVVTEQAEALLKLPFGWTVRP